MTDYVVNVKVVGRKGCDVFIGRPSKWGNPFVIGKHGTREEVIVKYAEWLYEQEFLLRAIHEELEGQVLGCFCAPLPCHGDILAELALEHVEGDIRAALRERRARKAGEPTPPLHEPHPALPDANHQASPARSRTEGEGWMSAGCVECDGVVLGLEHCDVCRQALHSECAGYQPLGARFICSVCADDDNWESAAPPDDSVGRAEGSGLPAPEAQGASLTDRADLTDEDVRS